jgi:hypothetical protein
MIKFKLIAATGLALMALPVAPALARDGTSGSTTSSGSTNTSTSTETENNTVGATETHKSGDSKKTVTVKTEDNKSESNKQKACQNRENSINNRLQNIASRGQKQLDVFTTVADRAEKFYTDNNLSLANYTTLVANVNSQKTTAQSTVDQIKADSVSFSCTGSDPKAALATFKTDLKAETTALKNYRTAVKNLIVGIKSVAGATEAENNG